MYQKAKRAGINAYINSRRLSGKHCTTPVALLSLARMSSLGRQLKVHCWFHPLALH